MNKFKLIKFILITFITLNIMNSIPWNSDINAIGKYGKILIAFIGLIYLIYNSFNKNINKIYNGVSLILFSLLIIIFSFNFYLENSHTLSFYDTNFKSIMLVTYIIFIYYITTHYFKLYIIESYQNSKSLVLNDIAKIFKNTILINTIIWITLALLTNQSMLDIDPTGNRSGFAGFTGDRMTFGLLLDALFLTALYNFKIDHNQKYYNLSILILTIIIIYFTDSRTALLICLIAIAFLIVKKYIKYIEFIVILLIILFISYNISNINIDNINEYSSGRTLVWTLFFNEFLENNVLVGHGLFNFNDVILKQYYFMSYYLDRIDFLYFHSSYIEILAATGIIGLYLFLIIIINIYRKSDNLQKSIILGISLGGIFESFLVSPIFPITLFLWIILILQNIKNEGIK